MTLFWLTLTGLSPAQNRLRGLSGLRLSQFSMAAFLPFMLVFKKLMLLLFYGLTAKLVLCWLFGPLIFTFLRILLYEVQFRVVESTWKFLCLSYLHCVQNFFHKTYK